MQVSEDKERFNGSFAVLSEILLIVILAYQSAAHYAKSL
jgi:hypothetical protein